VYPKVFRVSSAHQEAREVAELDDEEWDSRPGPVHGPGGDVRVFSAFTLGFAAGPDGHVRALRLAGTIVAGTRGPQPGTEREIPADLVLLALGFTGPDPDSGLMEQCGLRLDQRGNFARDAGFRGGPDGVFVAGDAGRGASLVVWAIAEGRAAAAAVDAYLMGASTLPAPVRPADRPLTA
jgi:glutamate synthase (NADPH/NADH) small chain